MRSDPEEFRRQSELDDMRRYLRWFGVAAVLILALLMGSLVHAGTPKQDRAARLMLLEAQRGIVKEATAKASRAHDAWVNRNSVALLPKEMKASSLHSGREDWFGSLQTLSDVSVKLYGVPVDFRPDPNNPERGQTFLKVRLLTDRIEAEIRTINDDIARDP